MTQRKAQSSTSLLIYHAVKTEKGLSSILQQGMVQLYWTKPCNERCFLRILRFQIQQLGLLSVFILRNHFNNRVTIIPYITNNITVSIQDQREDNAQSQKSLVLSGFHSHGWQGIAGVSSFTSDSTALE